MMRPDAIPHFPECQTSSNQSLDLKEVGHWSSEIVSVLLELLFDSLDAL